MPVVTVLGKQGQENHSKFEATLVFIAGLRTARATWQDDVSKIENK